MVANRISNGGFDGDLANWTALNGAAFVANEGYKELGAAYLASASDAIRQSFAIPVSRPWFVEMMVKGTSSGNVTLTITDEGGNTVYTNTITVTTSWAKAMAARVGLPLGTYNLTLTYGSVACYVDDISIARVEKPGVSWPQKWPGCWVIWQRPTHVTVLLEMAKKPKATTQKRLMPVYGPLGL